MAKIIKLENPYKKITDYITPDEIRSILYSIEGDLDRSNDLMNWQRMYLKSKTLHSRLKEIIDSLNNIDNNGDSNT